MNNRSQAREAERAKVSALLFVLTSHCGVWLFSKRNIPLLDSVLSFVILQASVAVFRFACSDFSTRDSLSPFLLFMSFSRPYVLFSLQLFRTRMRRWISIMHRFNSLHFVRLWMKRWLSSWFSSCSFFFSGHKREDESGSGIPAVLSAFSDTKRKLESGITSTISVALIVFFLSFPLLFLLLVVVGLVP